VLATILATPCTAPFLGAALGFAFVQPAPLIILMFLTVGLGLALPYLVLSWNPGWLRFLPKPGVWMENFKIAMGFPMLATSFWLFSLIPIHYGDRSWWLGIFLVVLGFAAWIYGRFVQRPGGAHGVALATVLVLLVAGYGFVIEGQLKWRNPQPAEATRTSLVGTGDFEWEPWSPQAVADARAAGRPVLVDFTAKWCLTCNTIVKPALESDAVRDQLKRVNGIALLGDYTRFPRNITEELNRYGRAGVPLVLVFPKDAGKDAIVLPEALTPGMVVDALKKAVL
jgi:thiol:disulfide interchange protein DsbD